MIKYSDNHLSIDIGDGRSSSSWQWVKLGEICEINPHRPTLVREDSAWTTFVPMSAIDEINGVIASPEQRLYSEVKKGYTFLPNRM